MGFVDMDDKEHRLEMVANLLSLQETLWALPATSLKILPNKELIFWQNHLYETSVSKKRISAN
jgi:hypothetical protein